MRSALPPAKAGARALFPRAQHRTEEQIADDLAAQVFRLLQGNGAASQLLSQQHDVIVHPQRLLFVQQASSVHDGTATFVERQLLLASTLISLYNDTFRLPNEKVKLKLAKSEAKAWQIYADAVKVQDASLTPDVVGALWLVEEALQAIEGPNGKQELARMLLALRGKPTATKAPPLFQAFFSAFKTLPCTSDVAQDDAAVILKHKGANVRCALLFLKHDVHAAVKFLEHSATLDNAVVQALHDAHAKTSGDKARSKPKKQTTKAASQPSTIAPAPTASIAVLNAHMSVIINDEEDPLIAAQAVCAMWAFITPQQRTAVLSTCERELPAPEPGSCSWGFIALLRDVEVAAKRLVDVEELTSHPQLSTKVATALRQHVVYDGYEGAALAFAPTTFACMEAYVASCLAQPERAHPSHMKLAVLLEPVMTLVQRMSPRLKAGVPPPESICSIEKHGFTTALVVKAHWSKLPKACRMSILGVEVEYYRAAMEALTAKKDTAGRRKVTEGAAYYRRQLIIEGIVAAFLEVAEGDWSSTATFNKVTAALNEGHKDLVLEALEKRQRAKQSKLFQAPEHSSSSKAALDCLVIAGHDMQVMVQMVDCSLTDRSSEARAAEKVLDVLRASEATEQLQHLVKQLEGNARRAAAVLEGVKGYLKSLRDACKTPPDFKTDLCPAWLQLCEGLLPEVRELWSLPAAGEGSASKRRRRSDPAEAPRSVQPTPPSTFLQAFRNSTSSHACPAYPGPSGCGVDVLPEAATFLLLHPRNLAHLFQEEAVAPEAVEAFLGQLAAMSATRPAETSKLALHSGEDAAKMEALQLVCRVFARAACVAPFDGWRLPTPGSVGLDRVLFIVCCGVMSANPANYYNGLALEYGMKNSARFAIFALRHQRHLRVLALPYHISAASLMAAMDGLVDAGAKPANVVLLSMSAAVANTNSVDYYSCSKGTLRRSAARSLDELFDEERLQSRVVNAVVTAEASDVWARLAALEGTTIEALRRDFPPTEELKICGKTSLVDDRAKALLQQGVRCVLFSDYEACTVRSNRLVRVNNLHVPREYCDDLRKHGIKLFGYFPGSAKPPHGIEAFDHAKHVLRRDGELWDEELYGRGGTPAEQRVAAAVEEALTEARAPPCLQAFSGCERAGFRCLLVTYDAFPGELSDEPEAMLPCHVLKAAPGGLAPHSRRLAEASCSELRRTLCSLCTKPATRGCPLVLRRLTHCAEHASALRLVPMEEAAPAGLVVPWQLARCCYAGCDLEATETFAAEEHRSWAWCRRHGDAVRRSMADACFCQSSQRFDGIHCACQQCLSLEEARRLLHGNRHIPWTPGRPVLLLEPPPHYQHLAGARPCAPPPRDAADLTLNADSLEVRQALERDLVQLLRDWKPLLQLKIAIVADDFLKAMVVAAMPARASTVVLTFEEAARGSCLATALSLAFSVDGHTLLRPLLNLIGSPGPGVQVAYPTASKHPEYQLLPRDLASAAHPAEKLLPSPEGLIPHLLARWLPNSFLAVAKLLARLRQVLHHLGCTVPGGLVRCRHGRPEQATLWHVLVLCCYDISSRRSLNATSTESLERTLQELVHFLETLCLTAQLTTKPIPMLGECLGKLNVPPVRKLCLHFLDSLDDVVVQHLDGGEKQRVLQGVIHAFNLHLPRRTPCGLFLKSFASRLSEQRLVAAKLRLADAPASIHLALQSARFHLPPPDFEGLVHKLDVFRSCSADDVFMAHCSRALNFKTAAEVASALSPPML